MASTGKYTAAELATLGGVPLRTIRFYIQQGLIDPPRGRGRGAHFDDRHLTQLKRTLSFQRAGLDNATIKQHGAELDAILAARGLTLETAGKMWGAFALGALTKKNPAEAEEEEDLLDPADAVRIPLAPGVELMVRRDVTLPSPKRLVELALFVRRIFKMG